MNTLLQIKEPILDELEEFKVFFDRSLDSSNHLMQGVIEHIKQKMAK